MVLLLWLINSYIPMERPVKIILDVAVVIILLFWIFKVCGFYNYLMNIKM
ncbi:MAG: Thivi_2564 family membrane protein [Bacteroidota bacterium]|nr:Thivi_2564 family membrane protein [Bacteroidota bacterium]